MTPSTIARRRARAALQEAFQYAGVPLDYIVFPHQDDHVRLLVFSELEVHWVRDNWSPAIAYICMEPDFTGVVCGDDMYRLSSSDAFDPEDYGFDRPYRFELPFDISDIEQARRKEWEDLPKAVLPRIKRQFKPKVIRSLKTARTYTLTKY
jgi:hypothetical protein